MMENGVGERPRRRLVHSSLQFFLNGSQSGSHPISTRLPLELEDAPTGSRTAMVNPRKLNVSGLPAVLGARPHNGQTRSDVSCPDATIARTFPTAVAYPPRSVWLHLRARNRWRIDAKPIPVDTPVITTLGRSILNPPLAVAIVVEMQNVHQTSRLPVRYCLQSERS